MKLNNKGYAITLIVFGILIVFVVVLSTLLITMNNSVKLNKTVKESVVENIQLSADTSGMSLTERIEQLESKLSDIDGNIIDTIYPVGSVYISVTDDSVDKVQEKFKNTKWEKYAQGRTLIGEGTSTDENGNIVTYTINSTGGNSNVSKINIDHTHNYDKVISGEYSTIVNHNHSINPIYVTLNNLPSDAIVFTHIGSEYNSELNPGMWSTGKWNNYGTDSYVTAPIYMTNKTHSQPINIGNTNSTGSSSGKISLSYDKVKTGTMNTNTQINAQEPYVVTYMYKRIE